MRNSACLADRSDLGVDLTVVTSQESAAINDHVDFVSACSHGVLYVGKLDRERRTPGWERGRYRRDFHRTASQYLLRNRYQVRVYAHRCHGRSGRIGQVWMHALHTHRADLARSVSTLERGQVDHPDRQVERMQLGVLLDRARSQPRDALVDSDLIHSWKAVQHLAEARIRSRDLSDIELQAIRCLRC